MKRVKIEIKLLIGSQAVRTFSTEARCCLHSDTYSLFATIKKELDKWKKYVSQKGVIE